MKKYFFLKISISFMALPGIASACSKATDNPAPVTPEEHVPGSTPSTINVTVSTTAGKLDGHGNAEDGDGTNARFWNPTTGAPDS